MATSQHLTAKGHTWTCYKEKELLPRRFTVIAVRKTTSAFIHGDGNRLGPSMSGGVAVSTATEKYTYVNNRTCKNAVSHLTCTIVQRHAHTHTHMRKKNSQKPVIRRSARRRLASKKPVHIQSQCTYQEKRQRNSSVGNGGATVTSFAEAELMPTLLLSTTQP